MQLFHTNVSMIYSLSFPEKFAFPTGSYGVKLNLQLVGFPAASESKNEPFRRSWARVSGGSRTTSNSNNYTTVSVLLLFLLSPRQVSEAATFFSL